MLLTTLGRSSLGRHSKSSFVHIFLYQPHSKGKNIIVFWNPRLCRGLSFYKKNAHLEKVSNNIVSIYAENSIHSNAIASSSLSMISFTTRNLLAGNLESLEDST